MSSESNNLSYFSPKFNQINSDPNATPIEDHILDSFEFSRMDPVWEDHWERDVLHVDITRTPGGNITVYLNSTNVMSAIDNTYTISEAILIGIIRYETYYDNIRVDDNHSFVPQRLEIPTAQNYASLGSNNRSSSPHSNHI